MFEYLTLPVFQAVRGRSIVVHGLQRSGNHLAIQWMCSGNRFDFTNNLLHLRTLYEQGRVDAHTHSLGGPALGRLTFYNWLWKQRRMVSIEDMSITHWLFEESPPRDIQQVLVMRCPINLFSSRIKRAFAVERPWLSRSMDELMLRSRRLWIEHAREAVGETSFLQGKVTLIYDRFIADRTYRAAIASQLGITPDDASLDRQADEGHGSSFHIGEAGRDKPESVEALRDRSQLLDDRERALLDQVMAEPELHRLRAKLLDFS